VWPFFAALWKNRATQLQLLNNATFAIVNSVSNYLVLWFFKAHLMDELVLMLILVGSKQHRLRSGIF
jgi:hypothetical protein